MAHFNLIAAGVVIVCVAAIFVNYGTGPFTGFASAVFSEQAEIIVDNSDGGFSVGWEGDGFRSSALRAGGSFYGKDFMISEPWQGDYAVWKLPIEVAGSYDIYSRWTTNTNRASDATYVIPNKQGVSRARVNQKAEGGVWSLLGTYDFEAGIYEVRLDDMANGVVVADAVKAVLVKAEDAEVIGEKAVPSCEDLCFPGEARCMENFLQSCGNYDRDECHEWPVLEEGRGSTFCELGCSGKVCREACEPHFACTDEWNSVYVSADCKYGKEEFCREGCFEGVCRNAPVLDLREFFSSLLGWVFG